MTKTTAKAKKTSKVTKDKVKEIKEIKVKATKAKVVKKTEVKPETKTAAKSPVINKNIKTSTPIWTLLTKEGFEKLKEELEFLKTTKRKEVSERLKEAISFWDLSENSEYEDAKNEQAFVEWRIIELEKKIKNAKIISDTHASIINIWSKVEVERKWTNIKEIYTIVWTTEAEPFKWRISNESPLWSALLWLKKWDVALVKAPKWEISYTILKIL